MAWKWRGHIHIWKYDAILDEKRFLLKSWSQARPMVVHHIEINYAKYYET